MITKKLNYKTCMDYGMVGEVEEKIQYLGGVWLALQKYGDLENKIGPFKISIDEALANDILEIFDWQSLDEVLKIVREKYSRKGRL